VLTLAISVRPPLLARPTDTEADRSCLSVSRVSESPPGGIVGLSLPAGFPTKRLVS